MLDNSYVLTAFTAFAKAAPAIYVLRFSCYDCPSSETHNILISCLSRVSKTCCVNGNTSIGSNMAKDWFWTKIKLDETQFETLSSKATEIIISVVSFVWNKIEEWMYYIVSSYSFSSSAADALIFCGSTIQGVKHLPLDLPPPSNKLELSTLVFRQSVA